MMFVVCNIGWMTHYNGNTDYDTISGGGSWPNKRKHEVYNFAKNGKYCYGYVKGGGIHCFNLSTIARKKIEDSTLTGVLVIWVAPRKTGGTYIVGWYKNATVYRDYVCIKGREYSFSVQAKYEDCILLPDDERTFEVFRSKKNQTGFLGRPNVWYGDSDSKAVKRHVADILSYIKNYRKGGQRKRRVYKVNVERNKKVEEVGIRVVTQYYERLGYKVKSVEKENKGWDLEATSGKNKCRIEVKSLSGSEISVRISRNEYKKMMAKDNLDYRLCVVTKALVDPILTTFVYDGRRWVCEEDNLLSLCFDEQVAAIAYVE